MRQTVTITMPNIANSVTQMAVDAALEAAQDWANAELQRVREELAPDPALADLFDTLRRLLPGTNADGSPLSDADLLARAIDKITTLEAEADLAAWRDIVMEAPPLRSDLLFANHSEIWVGQAHAVDFINTINGERPTEIVYYRNGDLMDGDPPIAWAILPILEDPADPGLDPVI